MAASHPSVNGAYANGAYAGPRWTREDPYPHLRGLLSPEFAELPAEDLDETLGQAFGYGTADAVENFWKKAASIGKSVGKGLLKAAPAIASTAMTGLSFTPMGLVAKGATGLIGAAVKGAAAGAGRGAAGRVPRGVGGALGGQIPLPTGSPAAAQLLKFLSRPQVAQAITQMALGTAGRRTVGAGSVRLPLGAIANTLGRLTEAAAEEYHALTASEGGGTPGYLYGPNGEFLSEPTDPGQRAQIVLQRFDEADAVAEEPESAPAPAVAWRRRSPLIAAESRFHTEDSDEQEQAEIEAELELAEAYDEEDGAFAEDEEI